MSQKLFTFGILQKHKNWDKKLHLCSLSTTHLVRNFFLAAKNAFSSETNDWKCTNVFKLSDLLLVYFDPPPVLRLVSGLPTSENWMFIVVLVRSKSCWPTINNTVVGKLIMFEFLRKQNINMQMFTSFDKSKHENSNVYKFWQEQTWKLKCLHFYLPQKNDCCKKNINITKTMLLFRYNLQSQPWIIFAHLNYRKIYLTGKK